MIRLHVICEGSTEEMFANELLVTPLMASGISLAPARIGRPGHKGGNVKFRRLLFDIQQRLLRDQHCYCTTLLDYYGLPGDFPGKADSSQYAKSHDKFMHIAAALSGEIAKELGEAGRRFIPYIQMHEFEGLLFSQPYILAQSLQMPKLAAQFDTIRNSFSTPEDINDSPNTAPAKRIASLFSGYDKPVHPVLAARAMGLDTIRRECPLFDEWIKQIEALPGGDTA
jgi:hypothetical protein